MTPEKRPSKVIIKYKDNALENTTYYPLGEVENPLREEDILLILKIIGIIVKLYFQLKKSQN